MYMWLFSVFFVCLVFCLMDPCGLITNKTVVVMTMIMMVTTTMTITMMVLMMLMMMIHSVSKTGPQRLI